MPRRLIPALVLIVLGTLFLLDNLGIAGIDAGRLLATWWPAVGPERRSICRKSPTRCAIATAGGVTVSACCWRGGSSRRASRWCR